MLRHVVLFTWKAGAPKAQIAAFADGLAELPKQVPEIRDLRFGPDARLGGGNEDFAPSPTSTTPTPTGATRITRPTAT